MPDEKTPSHFQWIERYAKPLLVFLGVLYMQQGSELQDERKARRKLDLQNDTLFQRVGAAEAENKLHRREDSIRMASQRIVPDTATDDSDGAQGGGKEY